MNIQIEKKLEDPVISKLEKSGIILGEEVLLETFTIEEEVTAINNINLSTNGVKKLLVVIDAQSSQGQGTGQVYLNCYDGFDNSGTLIANFVDSGIPSTSSIQQRCALGFEIRDGLVYRLRWATSLQNYPLSYYETPISTNQSNPFSAIMSCRVYVSSSSAYKKFTVGTKIYIYGVLV